MKKTPVDPEDYHAGPEAVIRFEQLAKKVVTTPPPRQKPTRRGRKKKRPAAERR